MKININDKEKMQAAIEKAETGCDARTIDIDEIPEMVEAAEKQLAALGIAKKYQAGCEIISNPPAVANKYFGRPGGTRATLRRYPSGWFLTSVYRVDCEKRSYGGGRNNRLKLGQQAKAAIPDQWDL